MRILQKTSLASIATRGDFDKAARSGASHQRTFDENHSETTGQAWIVPLLAILSVFRFRADRSRKDGSGELTAKVAKLESACAQGHKEVLQNGNAGEGRMIYCMQAHEDKISIKCAFELGRRNKCATTADAHERCSDCLHKPRFSGVCGKILPGQGRIARVWEGPQRPHPQGKQSISDKLQMISAKRVGRWDSSDDMKN